MAVSYSNILNTLSAHMLNNVILVLNVDLDPIVVSDSFWRPVIACRFHPALLGHILA